jgi:hypothetical protein
MNLVPAVRSGYDVVRSILGLARDPFRTRDQTSKMGSAPAATGKEWRSMSCNWRRWIFVIGSLVVGCGLGSTPEVRAESWHVTIGPVPRGGTYPIVCEAPDKVAVGLYKLQPADKSAPIVAQVFAEGEHKQIAMIVPGAASDYTLEAVKAESLPVGAGVAFKADGRNLAVSLDSKPLTVYRVDAGPKPFFYPLIGPTGDAFTRAYPMENIAGEKRDHPHHRSFWFTHGSVNGTDFWAETTKNGSIEETERQLVVQGPVLGRLKTHDEWKTREGRKICDDERVVTFYSVPNMRVIDFDIVIKASVGPVSFGDTKEGMFGLRVASSMDVTNKTGGRITNAEGLIDDKTWGKASPWVDYVGPVNGKTVGITMLNHPTSFRYPTTWHVRTYGLFAANPFGWKDFGMKERGDYTIVPTQEMAFRYRVVLHEGGTDPAKIAALFQVYSEPPTVLFKEN